MIAERSNHSPDVYSSGAIFRFVEAALQEEAHLKKPRRISEAQWVRDKNILGVYFYTQASMQNLASMYWLTREGISQIIEKTIKRLWQNSSSKVQLQFPLDAIVVAKPNILLKGRRQGIEEILPKMKATKPTLAERIAEASQDQEVQELLNTLSYDERRRAVKGNISLILPIKRIIFPHFRPPNRGVELFANSLQEAGVPVGKKEYVNSQARQKLQRNFFILARDQERAMEVWQKDQRLAGFKGNKTHKLP